MSWTCPQGHTVGDVVVDKRVVTNPLICPQCAADASERAIAEAQPEYLRRAIDGQIGLRMAKGPVKHVICYATTQPRTFCKVTLNAMPKLEYRTYNADTLREMCVGCRIAIQHVLAEGIAK
jgi:hypothetical protein